MKRILAGLLAGAMLLGLSACGKDAEGSSPEPVTAETETSAEMTSAETTSAVADDTATSVEECLKKLEALDFSFDDIEIATNEKGKYIVPPLSDKVPENAAYKGTVKKFARDFHDEETNALYVIYFDEHGNKLLRLVSKDGGELAVDENCSYEYDANGNILVERCVSDYVDRIVKYRYDENGRKLAQKAVCNGAPNDVEYYEYDEYGNEVFNCHGNYGVFEPYELSDEPLIWDKRNLQYDARGNILSYDLYKHGKDTLYSTFTLTYDDKDRVLTSEEVFADYSEAPDENDYGERLTFEYGAYSDAPTLYTESVLDAPDHIDVTTTEERRYDEKGRIVYFKRTNTKYDNVVTETVTEYEDYQ